MIRDIISENVRFKIHMNRPENHGNCSAHRHRMAYVYLGRWTHIWCEEDHKFGEKTQRMVRYRYGHQFHNRHGSGWRRQRLSLHPLFESF